MCAMVIAACTSPTPRSHAPLEAGTARQRPAGASAAAVSVAVVSGASDAAVDANLVRQGYHLVRRGDQVRYCRTETVTGTAFSSTVCLTPEQIQEQKRSLQHSQDDLMQPRGITCAGKLCSGG